MKLLELNEEELNMFINQNTTGEEMDLVKLLEMEEVESEEVTKLVLKAINK